MQSSVESKGSQLQRGSSGKFATPPAKVARAGTDAGGGSSVADGSSVTDGDEPDDGGQGPSTQYDMVLAEVVLALHICSNLDLCLQYLELRGASVLSVFFLFQQLYQGHSYMKP
eukprot:1725009-Amphidinium_carterae.1